MSKKEKAWLGKGDKRRSNTKPMRASTQARRERQEAKKGKVTNYLGTISYKEV